LIRDLDEALRIVRGTKLDRRTASLQIMVGEQISAPRLETGTKGGKRRRSGAGAENKQMLGHSTPFPACRLLRLSSMITLGHDKEKRRMTSPALSQYQCWKEAVSLFQSRIRRKWLALFLGTMTLILFAKGRGNEPDLQKSPVGPLTPKEELATFRVAQGFRVELVACEPNVIDPVAMAFDEDGRLFVAEMPGYPNGGVATGDIHSGQIKLLEDRDGDGFFEQAITFADDLRFPSSVMPWKGGLIAAVAPDIIYFEGGETEAKLRKRRTLYTGFGLENIEQLINGLQWGLDNWVYGCAGSNGGTIRSVEKPAAPAVTLRNRGVRFRPDHPGSLEPTSGGGQFGLAADDWEQWFTATNSQHLRHIILPDHYLRRNPALAVPGVTLDIPDHGAACKVFRISPFEPWRVERTRRRKQGPEAARFAATELVPGGFITSACSPVIYTAGLFPEAYQNNSFVCEPANNLVHRDILVPHGATFVAQRAEADSEFLASTDTWFRPVCLTLGPDGALYVADFYREMIETPLSLPDDIKANLNLESRGRGRIWRIVSEESRPAQKPALGKASTEELVKHLAHRNSWWRLTAQRLLVERQDKSATKALKSLAREAESVQGRARALWTLRGLDALDDSLVIQAIQDSSPRVREQALRLAEDRLGSSASLREAAARLADDTSPRVRFQLAFTLGEADSGETTAALAKIIRRDGNDPWTRAAILSSAFRCAPALLESLIRDQEFTARAGQEATPLLTQLAALVGARPGYSDLTRALKLIGESTAGGAQWQNAILTGLGQGLQNSQRSLSGLWEKPPPEIKEVLEQTRPIFRRAAETAQDEKRSSQERIAAARLLAFAPLATALEPLGELLQAQKPSDLQTAAVRALANHADSVRVADILLARWGGYSPALRREVLEALLARPERLSRLLDAIEQNKVLPGQLEPARLEQIRKYPGANLRHRAEKLLAGQATPDRKKVLEDYQGTLQFKPGIGQGKLVFKRVCSTCHRLENEGVEVGPDLLSALRTKTPETLLVDILDPSREVDPRYLNYQVTTKAGRVFTGMIAAETASSITLRRAEKAEDTVLRNQIEEIQATAKSLMPDGLEMQLTKQDVADVIGYLLSVTGNK
jgi:putative membrane-bound dehydrogenase-like protein